MGATKRGKGTKLMAVADRFGLPLAARAASATPHEVTLVAPTLDSRFVHDPPRRLIGDRAYDANGLDWALARLGVEMIAQHRRGRVRPTTQDGRLLKRYRDAGRLNGSSPGWAISAAWWCAISSTRSTT